MNKQVFEDMEVIKEVDKTKVKVRCSKCGRTKIMSYYNLVNRIGSNHQWCCRQIKGKYPQHFYRKWSDMRTRTTNEKHDDFYLYGGRGINSDAWKYFIDFYDDMYDSYSEHVEEFGEHETSLERINVNGNYCKENCCWVTLKEQAGNRRTNKTFKAISPNGDIFLEKNQRKFAEEHNLMPQAINNCLSGLAKSHKGWKFEYVIAKGDNLNEQ